MDNNFELAYRIVTLLADREPPSRRYCTKEICWLVSELYTAIENKDLEFIEGYFISLFEELENFDFSVKYVGVSQLAVLERKEVENLIIQLREAICCKVCDFCRFAVAVELGETGLYGRYNCKLETKE